MSLDENEVHLTLHLEGVGGDFDADELNQLTDSLMRSLEDVGVESVTVVRDQGIPLGAKGDPVTIGALAVAVLPTILPKVMEFLQEVWTVRNKNQTVTARRTWKDSSGVERSVEIEFPANMPPDKLKKQVEAFRLLDEK